MRDVTVPWWCALFFGVWAQVGLSFAFGKLFDRRKDRTP
jgi:hypothetical protein